MAKWNGATIRELERSSIREFLQSCPELSGKRVLDMGCGKEPYRDVVEALGSEYEPYDRADFPGSTVEESVFRIPPKRAYGAVMCTQVIQYIRYPSSFLVELGEYLVPGGHLVITYPTCWDEIETDDLFRYTLAGMGLLLQASGFDVMRNEHRAHVPLGDFKFHLGGGAVGRVRS